MASFCLSFLLFLTVQHFANAEKCLSGPYHKNSSSAGDQNFVECLSYKKDACCTSALTQTVKNHPEKLYNFTWHHCNTISSVRFLLHYLHSENVLHVAETHELLRQWVNDIDSIGPTYLVLGNKLRPIIMA